MTRTPGFNCYQLIPPLLPLSLSGYQDADRGGGQAEETRVPVTRRQMRRGRDKRQSKDNGDAVCPCVSMCVSHQPDEPRATHTLWGADEAEARTCARFTRLRTSSDRRVWECEATCANVARWPRRARRERERKEHEKGMPSSRGWNASGRKRLPANGVCVCCCR